MLSRRTFKTETIVLNIVLYVKVHTHTDNYGSSIHFNRSPHQQRHPLTENSQHTTIYISITICNITTFMLATEEESERERCFTVTESGKVSANINRHDLIKRITCIYERVLWNTWGKGIDPCIAVFYPCICVCISSRCIGNSYVCRMSNDEINIHCLFAVNKYWWQLAKHF